MTHAPGLYGAMTRRERATTCRERELTFDHIHTFLTTQEHEGPPGWGISSMPGPSLKQHELEKTHAIHANKVNMKGWLWRPNDIRGPCGPETSWHLSYCWGKAPKNFTQETCPDRRSNPGPLLDRCACYRLPHRGGRFRNLKIRIIKRNWIAPCRKVFSPLNLVLRKLKKEKKSTLFLVL